jgi:hypothetical protein
MYLNPYLLSTYLTPLSLYRSHYRSSSKHIVICGSLNSITLESFFEELFHEDHNNIGLSTVVLVPHPPSIELQLLISTVYSHAVIFLEGSAMLQKDLRRADVQGAGTTNKTPPNY